MSRLLYNLKGRDVVQQDNGDFSFIGRMMIDDDGDPEAYNPQDTGRDFLANAKDSKGNFVGVETYPDGRPVINPHTGFYVSETSLKHFQFPHGDPRRYVNPQEVAGVVCPSSLARAASGIVLGCRVTIKNSKTGQVFEGGVCHDIGPRNGDGEVAPFTARIFGVNDDPKEGGTDDLDFIYTFHAGQAADGFTLQPLGT